MKIVKLSHNKYIKVKDEIESLLLEDVKNIYDILEQNSDGQNGHNHNNLYHTKEEIEMLLRNYPLLNHNHLKDHYTKEEVVNLINNSLAENPFNDEIHVSELPPTNNEKIWFKIIK